MLLEKIPLTKEYEKVMEYGFSIVRASFEIVLYHVEDFYPTVHISREPVHPNRKIVYGVPIFVKEDLDMYPFFYLHFLSLVWLYLVQLQ